MATNLKDGESSPVTTNPAVLKARELVRDGDKKLTKFSLFGFGGNKYEEALDFYEQAVNKFKLGKSYKEAADTYVKMVNCYMKTDSKFEAASCYADAAKLYSKVSVEDATRCMQQAVNIFTDSGRFSNAAKLEVELAELLEEEGHLEEAVQHLKTAADFYEGENQKSSQNSTIVKIAHLQASLGNYLEAIEAFEQAAQNAVSDKLLKWGAKDLLFKASILQLAKLEDPKNEAELIADSIERYKDIDVHFVDSLESKLIDNLMKSCTNGDLKGFATALRNYDSICKLDTWKTNMLLRIRSKLEEKKTALETDFT